MAIPQITNFDYYKPSEYLDILNKISKIKFINTPKGTAYANIPVSFDIETTNTYSNNWNKIAFMYEWTFNICGFTIIGRYWEEFIELLNNISKVLDLSIKKVLIVYVHNLSFEFQFLRTLFNWDSVFALENREPVKALTNEGIEFRCSYKLSGYKLSKLAEQLTKHSIKKLSGDLDYSLIRNSRTELSNEELQYCINDCLIVVYYIDELIERLGNITKIPLTKTGFVRRHCRNKCLYNGNHSNDTAKYRNYRKLMNELVLDKEVYEQLKRAFAGGFTHASVLYSGDIVNNVSSFDFTSSYPYVMVSEKFPMSRAKIVEIKSDKQLLDCLNRYCCLFDVTFENLEPAILYENYISRSKCWNVKNCVENNGRVVEAEKLSMTITEQDYFIIRDFYKWESMTISNFRIFSKSYLPHDFVEAILELYKIKTELKGVEGKEVEYLVAKENLNSCYGMMVTDICRPEIKYSNSKNWTESEPDIENALKENNESVKRFLYYPWGVWVTAYARRNLFTGIKEFGDDYVYSDTDSIKCRNVDKHRKYIEEYNKSAIAKLKKASIINEFDIEQTRPKNKKGEVKQIGIWEEETIKHKYDKFKTLGAKRYLIKIGDKYILTVSGLNKDIAIKYMIKKFKDKIFDRFSEGMYIPPDHTGKLTHTYIDEPFTENVIDYQGKKCVMHENSCVHLEGAEYSLSIADAYAKYLLGIQSYEK